MIGAYAAGKDADSRSSDLSEIGQGVGVEAAAIILHVDDIEREAAFRGALLGEEPGPFRGGGNESQSGRPTQQIPRYGS